MTRRWIGPLVSDLEKDGTTLLHSVPPERWPFGPPEAHEDGCWLHQGGLYCDCLASSATDHDDEELPPT